MVDSTSEKKEKTENISKWFANTGLFLPEAATGSFL